MRSGTAVGAGGGDLGRGLERRQFLGWVAESCVGVAGAGWGWGMIGAGEGAASGGEPMRGTAGVRGDHRSGAHEGVVRPGEGGEGGEGGEEVPQGGGKMTLGMGNYGLRSLSVVEAVGLIERTGFEAVELSLMPDWPSAPERLPEGMRGELRRRLGDSGLKLRALMEDLPPAVDQAGHQRQMERLKRAGELGRALSPDERPLVQTVLGGGKWEEQRPLYVERLGEWRALAEREELRIAIKPHRFGAMSLPAMGLELLRELGDSVWLGLVYDSSHYAFREVSLRETLAEALPKVWHVAVKDVKRREGGVEFELPGVAGTIDHGAMLGQLREGGYGGDVCCEISGQVFKREGYDPVVAVETCAREMRGVFERAGMPRRGRRSQ